MDSNLKSGVRSEDQAMILIILDLDFGCNGKFFCCSTPSLIARMNQSIQVEGAFVVIKEDGGGQKFLMQERKMSEPISN